MKAARESTDGPRQRRARQRPTPGASLTVVAQIAGVSRSIVVNADELAKEARKVACETTTLPAQAGIGGPKPAKPTDRRERAQQFLRDALAHGPQRVLLLPPRIDNDQVAEIPEPFHGKSSRNSSIRCSVVRSQHRADERRG